MPAYNIIWVKKVNVPHQALKTPSEKSWLLTTPVHLHKDLQSFGEKKTLISPFKFVSFRFIWAHVFNLHWLLSGHVFSQCCVYVQIHEALLCLCLYVSIKYGRVIFHMCRQLRCNSPRGRAESWSTSQRGSWYRICLNMPSIQVMEPLRFPLNNPLLLCSSYRCLWRTHCTKCKR